MLFIQWCTFRHSAMLCDYEWKRADWNVTVADCSDYQNRADFQVSFMAFYKYY